MNVQEPGEAGALRHAAAAARGDKRYPVHGGLAEHAPGDVSFQVFAGDLSL